MDAKADYGILDELATNRINIKLIIKHWDDLLRLAGSLKLDVVRAAGLTRVLQTNDRPRRLARALQELGRLVKSLYLLRFIDDESYRRRILVQLNRGDGRHQVARVIFHGMRGELRQRYREGQEDQLGALGIVVLSGDTVNPSGGDTRNPSPLRSRDSSNDRYFDEVSTRDRRAETADENAGRSRSDPAVA